MRLTVYILVFLIGSGLVISCSGGSDSDTNNTQNTTNPNTNPPGNTGGNTGGTTSNPPGSFSLTFPNNNEVCQEGAAVANQPDKLLINFKWASSANATSYEITVVESESGNEVTKVTTDQTNQDVQVDKGVLYLWNITAKNNDGEFATSNWSFYSKGESIANYVPYPAYNITFTFDAVNDLLTVQWEATDEDGDALSYDVQLFEDGIEILNETGLTDKSISNIPVAVGATYYAIIQVSDGLSAVSTTSEEYRYD